MIAFDYRGETSRGWRDLQVGVGIAVAAFLLQTVWSYPMLHPGVWDEVAIAAGVREPVSPLNGLYRTIVHGLFSILPASVALGLLPILGRGVIAVCVACVYMAFVDGLPPSPRLAARRGWLAGHLGCMVAFVATVLFLGVDPVWRAGQTFSPVTLFIAANVALWTLFVRFVRHGALWSLDICSAILGGMAADSVLGFLLSGIAVLALLRAASCARDLDVPFVNLEVGMRICPMTFVRLGGIWGAALALQVAVDYWIFKALGGLEASGCVTASDYPVVYLRTLVQDVVTAASPLGWLFTILVCVIPLVLALRLLPACWNEGRPPPCGIGLVFCVVGVVSLAQVSGGPSFWFWLWFEEMPLVEFTSDTLLSSFLILNVVVCALSLAVLGVEVFCRGHARRERVLRRRAFFLVALFASVVTLWGCRQPQTREMMRVLSDYADEVLEELGSRNVLFTDGAFDAWLEVKAKAEGRELRTLSLVASNTSAETRVRLRIAETEEEEEILMNGAAAMLRSWLTDKSPRLASCGVQVGFELWRRTGTDLPPLSGTMALPGAVPDEETHTRSRKSCEALTRAILALDGRHVLSACPDRAVRHLFPFVVWRLSRLAVLWGRTFDKAGHRDEAFEAAATADELDGVNYALEQFHRDSKWISRLATEVVAPTPREGLVIGLARADFVLAAQFAQPILRSDPDDPRANFAVGMKFYMDEQYARAEYHLARCVRKRPDEPAALNNLAMAQLRQNKLDEAEANARKALDLIPASQEIRQTLESVLAAKKNSREAVGSAGGR